MYKWVIHFQDIIIIQKNIFGSNIKKARITNIQWQYTVEIFKQAIILFQQKKINKFRF